MSRWVNNSKLEDAALAAAAAATAAAYTDAALLAAQVGAERATVATSTSIGNLAAVTLAALGGGYTPLVGEKVLVLGTASRDGIEAVSLAHAGLYVVGAIVAGVAPLTRDPRYDSAAELAGASFLVERGAYSGFMFGLPLRAADIVLETTGLGFVVLSGGLIVTSGEAYGVGAPIALKNTAGAPQSFQADADGTGRTGMIGIASIAASGAGEVGAVWNSGQHPVPDVIWDAVPGVADAGSPYYVSQNQGKLTLTRPPLLLAVKGGRIAVGGVGLVQVTVDISFSYDATYTVAGFTDATIAAANKDGLVGTPSMRTIGTGGLQAAAGTTLATAEAYSDAGDAATALLSHLSTTTGEAIAAGAPVALQNAAGVPKSYNADADGAGTLANLVGLAATGVGSGAALVARRSGTLATPDAAWDSVPVVGDVGKRYYVSTTAGILTLTRPALANVFEGGTVVVGGTGAVVVSIAIKSSYDATYADAIVATQYAAHATYNDVAGNGIIEVTDTSADVIVQLIALGSTASVHHTRMVRDVSYSAALGVAMAHSITIKPPAGKKLDNVTDSAVTKILNGGGRWTGYEDSSGNWHTMGLVQ